jgi:hypothetical protein
VEDLRLRFVECVDVDVEARDVAPRVPFIACKHRDIPGNTEKEKLRADRIGNETRVEPDVEPRLHPEEGTRPPERTLRLRCEG